MEEFYNVEQSQPNAIDPRYLVQDTSSFVDYRNTNIYKFMLESYRGEGGFRDGSYLIPFQRETFYADRCMTAVYKNFFKPIVDSMILPVFNNEIQRETTSELFAKFCDNVDAAGTSMTDFCSCVLTNSRTCGFSFVIIDNYEDVGEYTLKETLELRRFPYMYEVTPDKLYKIETDQVGKVTSITFFWDVEKVNDKKVDTFIRWDKEKSLIYYEGKNNDEVVLQERVHDLGKIPVIISNYFIKDKKFKELPAPILYDIAMLNFSLFQKETYIQELEKYQTFSLLVCQGIDPKQLSVGPSNFINVADNVSNLPTYISPNTDNTRTLVENCNRLKDEIYLQAGQKGVIAVKQESGIAKEWDFRSEESVLKDTAKAAVLFEKQVAEIFGLYIKEKNIEVESKYPQDFSPQYYDIRVKQIIEILKNNPPQGLVSNLWQEITEIMYKQTPDKAKEIIDEIKEEFDTENNIDEVDLTNNGDNSNEEEIEE